MGVINPHNTMQFISASTLFSKIKRDLKSFTNVGLIDENDFYDYAVDVLDSLGLGGLKEEQAILEVKNNKAKLPEGFKQLYAAYKCTFNSRVSNRPHLQNSYAFYTDTTYEKAGSSKGCEISCPNTCTQRDKITVREYVQGLETIHNFSNPQLLRLSPNTTSLCSDKCQNLFSTCSFEIGIDNGYLTANFDDSIYIKYYALALDDEGLPLIPDSKAIRHAIEYYIKYNLFLNWYLNDDVPGGVNQRAAELKKLYQEAFAQAYHESKLPTFMGLVDTIRMTRHSKDVYRQIEKY